MKKIFTLIAACALTIGASAQTMDASYDAETKTVSVNLTNEEAVTSFTFAYLIPEGTTIATYYDEDEDENIPATVRNTNRVKGSKWNIDIRAAKVDGVAGWTMCTGFGSSIKAGEGAIWDITLDAVSEGEVKFVNAQVFMGKEIDLPAFAVELSGTAITKINANAEDNVMYNLAGQRVNKAQKGIVIENGKKVIK